MSKFIRKAPHNSLITVPVNNYGLPAELEIPPKAKGLVIFAHGSGSSRHSPRNQLVAGRLRQSSLATLLIDLLTPREDEVYKTRFDIGLLAERLAAITDWATHNPQTQHLQLGYFGASTGAAAAMLAASDADDLIKAVVSRGGRVDLADRVTQTLKAPTLLIVGHQDIGVRELNEETFLNLKCKKELAVVPKATHLFEEPGTLEQVAELAASWFKKYLG